MVGGKFGRLLLVLAVLEISLLTVGESTNSSITITNSGVISAVPGLHYAENAVWVQDASWSGMLTPNILTNNLTRVVSELSQNNIKYAFIFVGYWNATTPSNPVVPYQHSDAFYANVINAFHSVNVKAIAWIEDGGGGTMDITQSNRQNIYNAIVDCMNKGFDGYNDDIESFTGTNQDYIDFLNNCTTVLHNLGKLMTADVAYDWLQDTNPYLHMDFIVSMFYSHSSKFEDPQGPYYWQEDFGEYSGHDTPPASPMIIGIMNCLRSGYNTQPLSWQLAQCSSYLATYGHPQLVGFSLWLYEYMGAYSQSDDWAQWNYWITHVDS